MGLPEILILLVVAAATYFLVWRWWLVPLYQAGQAHQWGWMAAMVIIGLIGPGWIVGLIYLNQRQIDTIVVADPLIFSKGDTVCFSGRMYRVLGKDGTKLTVLNLGQRSTVGT